VPFTLMLYRGFFGGVRPFLRVGGDSYVISPESFQQNVLWFTHPLIHGYDDYLDYARVHGTYLLTLPLLCWQHQQREVLNDGSRRSIIPAEIQGLDTTPEGAEGSRFWCGIEVPEGWFFSYKIERFLCCERELVACRRHIRRLGSHHLR
jgi:hypothetical protein